MNAEVVSNSLSRARQALQWARRNANDRRAGRRVSSFSDGYAKGFFGAADSIGLLFIYAPEDYQSILNEINFLSDKYGVAK